MAATAEINTYLNNHYEGMSPEQLILVLFKAALERLQKAKEGVEENNIQKRGENLSKAIAIISELNASVDSTMTDEHTQFLRGLYASILAELPKVSITNDVTILTRTHKYISKLKEIWEKDVMGKENTKGKKPALTTVKPQKQQDKGYPGQSGTTAFRSFSV
jgi:flagellar protein FliS